jgi:hypothetical protein
MLADSAGSTQGGVTLTDIIYNIYTDIYTHKYTHMTHQRRAAYLHDPYAAKVVCYGQGQARQAGNATALHSAQPPPQGPSYQRHGYEKGKKIQHKNIILYIPEVYRKQ